MTDSMLFDASKLVHNALIQPQSFGSCSDETCSTLPMHFSSLAPEHCCPIDPCSSASITDTTAGSATTSTPPSSASSSSSSSPPSPSSSPSEDPWLNWLECPPSAPSEQLFGNLTAEPAVNLTDSSVSFQQGMDSGVTLTNEELIKQSEALLDDKLPGETTDTSAVVEQAFGESSSSVGLSPKFPEEELNDFKHVLYNLLAEHHNNPSSTDFVLPCTVKDKGGIRQGFRFNPARNPDKLLPELYARHIRKARLDLEDGTSIFTHDLYKYYLRASVELLSKYFEKKEKYTYLYVDQPLFVPNDTLEKAENRIKAMRSRSRKRKRG